MEWRTLLVDVLTGAWSGAFGYSSREHGDELADSSSLEKLKLDRSVTLTSSWAGLGSLRRIYLETLERRAVKKRKLQTPM